MEVRHTGSFELYDEIKDMEYLGHLGALGSDIIDQSVYAGEDWQAVHAAHAAFIQTLHRAYLPAHQTRGPGDRGQDLGQRKHQDGAPPPKCALARVLSG